jgi:hypothetical protein
MRNIFKKLAGLFRPKPDAMEVAINVIPTALQLQLSLADSSKTSAASLINDSYALGYIFGYHDAVLQRLKVDDQTTCLAIMAVSYDTIFGGVDNGAPLFRKSLDIQNDEMFRKGMIKGGGEAVAFFREEKIPFGLSEWLSR